MSSRDFTSEAMQAICHLIISMCRLPSPHFCGYQKLLQRHAWQAASFALGIFPGALPGKGTWDNPGFSPAAKDAP
jgi:hypothetical protein